MALSTFYQHNSAHHLVAIAGTLSYFYITATPFLKWVEVDKILVSVVVTNKKCRQVIQKKKKSQLTNNGKNFIQVFKQRWAAVKLQGSS